MALTAKPFLLLLLVSPLPFLISCAPLDAFPIPPLVDGLSWDFYDSSCPQLEVIIRDQLLSSFSTDIGLAAGILRVFFHDCFVQGCDGSVLLAGEGGEQSALQNRSLRPEALAAIEELRAAVEAACGSVVSCADITAIAARESVYLSGGPYFQVPLGRRDALTGASGVTAASNLPNATDSVATLLKLFSSKSLSLVDLVALSGAHTIGVGHCPAFANRLYPTQDPTLNPAFAQQLYLTCPDDQSINLTANDLRTPDAFDNRYFVDLANNEGLFTSDQGLFVDDRTRLPVEKFAGSQWLFFEAFARAMVKMSQFDVITGSKGEIRSNCSVRNSASPPPPPAAPSSLIAGA